MYTSKSSHLASFRAAVIMYVYMYICIYIIGMCIYHYICTYTYMFINPFSPQQAEGSAATNPYSIQGEMQT